MDIISKSVFVGCIYLTLVIIYGNLPLTKKKLQGFDDKELVNKNEQFKMLSKLFLAIGFLSPVILILPLFFISKSKALDGYLAIITLIVICTVASGMMYFNLKKITSREIKHRKMK